MGGNFSFYVLSFKFEKWKSRTNTFLNLFKLQKPMEVVAHDILILGVRFNFSHLLCCVRSFLYARGRAYSLMSALNDRFLLSEFFIFFCLKSAQRDIFIYLLFIKKASFFLSIGMSLLNPVSVSTEWVI